MRWTITLVGPNRLRGRFDLAEGAFVTNWLESWLASWALMAPIVFFAAPAIQRVTLLLTRDEQ